MAATQPTLTAPRAIIKVNGKAIGFIRGFSATENIARTNIMGLGRITDIEKPAVAVRCTWNADMYTIDWANLTNLTGLDERNVQSQEQYKNTLTLAEIPIDIYIYKKDNPTVVDGVVTATDDTVFVVIRNAYMNTRGFNINEGQVSGTNLSGEYTDPIINPT
jgi:hypothetical protein